MRITKTTHTTCLFSVAAVICMAAYFSRYHHSFVASAQEKALGQNRLHTKTNANFASTPLTFEANQGQAAKPVKFISRGMGYNLLLTANEAVLSLHTPTATTQLQMSLLAANRNPAMSGIEELPGKTHFFVGNDPRQWKRNIVNYAKVKYTAVYPGIDLLYYGNQSQFEYDFIVQPGADPKAIQFTLRGARKMWIDAQGDLVLETSEGEVRQHKPVVYQEINGERKSIAGDYILKNNRISFAVGVYDANYPLVIDPVISYATLLNASNIARRSIAVDAQGNAYLTGNTSTDSFPTTSGALNQGAGQQMAFVTKLSQDGSWPVYTAVFGGTTGVSSLTPFTSANAITVDAQGNAYVTGSTNTGNFPTTANAYKKAAEIAGRDGYVLKLNPTGSEIVFSTLLGGSQEDTPTGLVLDAAGNPCLVGTTSSPDFPNTDTRYKKIGNADAAFVARLNKEGTSLLHANILDAAGRDLAVGIAIDAAGNLYVTGTTSDGYDFTTTTFGARFPRTTGAYDFGFSPISPLGQELGGVQDGVFVAKVGANGKLVYSTVVGQGQAGGIVADRNGNAFVVGRSNFIVKTGDYGQPNFKAARVFPETDRTFVTTVDPNPQYGPLSGGMFLVEMNTAGDQLLLSHRIEADSGDGYGIAIDQQGYLHITGGITLKFPVGNGDAIELENLFALYPYTPGNRFAFYLKVDPSGKSFVDVEFLRSAIGRAITVDIAGNAYVSGIAGAGFSTTPNAFQTKLPEGTNPQAPFVAKFGNEPIPGAVLVKSTATVSGQVTDKKGNGLAGATVKIKSERLANAITQITDKDGKYSLPNLPKGANYTVEARKAGYELLPVQPSDWAGINLNLVNSDQVVNFAANREPSVAVVNAANYQPSVAIGSIASAFGSNLAPAVKVAGSKPLPNTLALVSVTVTDSQGNARLAPLFYVSPTQVNFQVPEGMAPGEAEILVNAHGILSLGSVTVEAVAPGVFSADSSGRGIAAAGLQCVLPGGRQTYTSLVDFNPQTSSFVPVAIDVNSGDQVYLILYGTGLRLRSQVERARARIGGQDLPVSFAGAQGDYVGVDQVNILLPKSLAGQGNLDINLTVDGKTANTVKVKIK